MLVVAGVGFDTRLPRSAGSRCTLGPSARIHPIHRPADPPKQLITHSTGDVVALCVGGDGCCGPRFGVGGGDGCGGGNAGGALGCVFFFIKPLNATKAIESETRNDGTQGKQRGRGGRARASKGRGGGARGTRSKTDSKQFFVKQSTRKRRNTTTETAKDDAVSAGKQKRNEKEKERPDARMPVATVGFDGGSR